MDLLIKFHDNQTVNVASRVKNAPCPPLGSLFFQANIIIFKLIQDIIKTNLLTKFHEDWTINVASRVLTRFYNSHIKKNALPLVATKTIFTLIQDIIGTNLLTKFHDDQKINVTSRVLTRKIALPPWWPYIIGMNLLTKKNAPPLGGHVFQANITENLLTIFHQDWTINVASRVLRINAPPPGGNVFQPISIIFILFHEDRKINVASRELTRKNAPPLGSHVFQAKVTIFDLIQDINRKINVASRVLTRKNAPPPGGHIFQPTGIIFKLVQDIIGMNLLTKFHEDRTINVTSRVLTRFYHSHISSHIRKNALPIGCHVFQAKVTIFELIQDISGTNLLSKFHEDRKINVAARVLTSHVFQPTGIIFELVQDIIGMNLLTKFYEEQTINVASRVKNAPPLGSHVFQANITIFDLIQDINRKINVASRELTRQMLTPHNGQRTTDKKRS
ncbi:hypothetical protein DPMN_140872 [Dreissena polymorpha]|uniref:Uncharacterized protein n=1 Tax=Dreissena polymorpha TaxID=45954 RepID=A0A9D4G8E6_DREPO|nr:hypothetical protein DPMN_140872 [Dreissena polymorpha]